MPQKSHKPPPLFQLEDATLSYQKHCVFEKLSLKIHLGEKVALIGPSGSGKSTLLRTLYQQSPKSSAFIHQHYALVPQLSSFHNVYMGRLDQYSSLQNLRNLVHPNPDIQAEVYGILETLGMSEKIFEKVHRLSGGQQQRVALARALFQQKEILFADEPVSSIDPHQAGLLLPMLIHSSETVILSLHSVAFALRFATRVIGIRNGIAFDLPPQEIAEPLLDMLYRPC